MSKPHKIKIGLLGLGTVGSGVYKTLVSVYDFGREQVFVCL